MKFFTDQFHLAGAILASTAAPAIAQDVPTTLNGAPASENHVIVGVGALAYRSPFKGEGTTTVPIPVLLARQGIFYVNGLEAGIRLEPSKDGPVRPALDIFGAARAIAGNDREKITGDVGARVSLASDYGTLSISYRRDATDTFNGGEAIARYDIEFPIGPVTVAPALQASWLDRKTSNHMYGITPRQQQKMIAKKRDVILPVYTVEKRSLNLGGDLTIKAELSDRIIAIGQLSGAYLGRSIRDNPGLRDEFEAQALIGLAYRF